MTLFVRMALASIWLLFTTFYLQAQVGVSLPVINYAVPGSIVAAPIRVTNFDSVTTMQYVLRWDPQVLQFQSVSNLSLPGLDLDDHFNLTRTLDSGYLIVAWTAPFLSTGVTIADETAIFQLNFKITGALQTSSALEFTQILPTSVFEIVTINNQFYTLSNSLIDQGFVAVGFMVAAGEPASGTTVLQVSPNPFTESARIVFEQPAAGPVRFQVFDTAGRLQVEKNLFLPAGPQSLLLSSASLRQKGTYLLLLRTGSQVSTCTVLFH